MTKRVLSLLLAALTALSLCAPAFASGEPMVDVPAAETAPEPEITAGPEATAEPEVTTEPEVTPEPEAAPEPETTPEPETMPEPETTAEPEVTAEPEAAPEAGDGTAPVSITDNKGDQDYSGWNWSSTVESYLVPLDSGFMALGPTEEGDRVLVKYLDDDYVRTSELYVDVELSLFGGFYAGTDAYYLVFGQENPYEDDTREVVRVVKYDRSWTRLGAASLYGANTVNPFQAGSLRMTEAGGYLYIRTCHLMYADGNGTNHQANLTIQVRTADMTVADAFSEVWNINYGYVSHSFNQFILVDDAGNLVGLDHGDARPRSAVLGMYEKKAGSDGFVSRYKYVNVFPFAGEQGSNYTGATLGGLEYSSTHYLVAGSSTAQDGSASYGSVRNIFVTATSRADFSDAGTTFRWITGYGPGEAGASTPQLVKMGSDLFALLWETGGGQLSYVFLDGRGQPAGPVYTDRGALSDCKPTVKDGDVVWFVSDSVLMTVYDLRPDGTLLRTVQDYAGTERPGGTFGEGGAMTWDINREGILTISGQGPVTGGECPWKPYKNGICGVDLQEGVTAIGDGVFSDCGGLAYIYLADTVASIGRDAFWNCDSLAGVTLPKGVTFVDFWAFSDCDSLTEVTVLNPYCYIAPYGTVNGEPVYTLGDPGKVTIRGYMGSTAEAYAANYGFRFLVTDGWQEKDGETYYYQDGAPLTGLQELDSGTYFFAGDGSLVRGELVTAGDGRMYYCAPGDGHIMKGGVQKVGGTFYYLSPGDGHVLTNGWVKVDGKNRYYADENGALLTGYKNIGKNSYYFSVKDAHLMKGGIATGPGGYQYYVSAKDGHAMKGGWARGQAIKTRPGYSYYYYLDAAGVVRVTEQLPTSTKVGSLDIPDL